MAKRYVSNTDSRLFIRKNNNTSGRYSYHACAALDGLTQNYGEVIATHCPDPQRYGQFVEIDASSGAKERATINLISKMPNFVESILYEIADSGDPFDIQLHWGSCYNPSVFNEFDMALILEDAKVTSYSTDTLVALTPDERAIITETTALSVGKFYYIKKINLKLLNKNAVWNGYKPYNLEVCDAGNCQDKKHCTIMALAYKITDTYENPHRLYVSKDGGKNWTFTSVISNPGEWYHHYMPSGIHADFTSITCFEQDTYLALADDRGNKVWYRARTSDLINGNAIGFDVIYEGANGLAGRYGMTSENKFLEFQGDYYAMLEPGVFQDEEDETAPGILAEKHALSHIIRFDEKIMGPQTIVYSPGYPNYPMRLRKYNNEYLYAGTYFSDQSGGVVPVNSMYFSISEDGENWRTIPIRINGWPVQIIADQEVFLRPYIVNDNLWIVTINNKKYISTDQGNSWVEIKQAADIIEIVINPIYTRATNNVWFSAMKRSYDGLISEVQLPDGDFNETYSTYITAIYQDATWAQDSSDARSVPYTCKENPNLMYLVSDDGILEFS